MLKYRRISQRCFQEALFILFLISILGQKSMAQSLTWKRDVQLNKGEKLAAIDKFGSIYTFRNSVLTKRDSIREYVYQNTDLGPPSSIDVQNPLKPLLYYRDYNIAIQLDNLFNEKELINLQNTDANLVSASVFNASQNCLWLCNETDQKIYRYEIKSRKLIPLTQSLRFNLKWFAADLNYFYFLDNDSYIWRVNFFGNLVSDFQIKEFDQLLLLDDVGWIYSLNNSIFCYNQKNKQIKKLDLPINNFQSFAVKGQFLAIFTNNEIKVYYLNIP